MEDCELWKAEQIAIYLGVKKKTVQNKVIHSDGFPAPRILRFAGSKVGTKRWLASEVRAWAVGNKTDVEVGTSRQKVDES